MVTENLKRAVAATRSKTVKLRVNAIEHRELLSAAGEEDLAVWVRRASLTATKPGGDRRAAERYDLALAVVFAANQIRDLYDLLEDRGVSTASIDSELRQINLSLRAALRRKGRRGEV